MPRAWKTDWGNWLRAIWPTLIVLDRDIYQIEPEEILELKVLGTMVGGEWRYRAFD